MPRCFSDGRLTCCYLRVRCFGSLTIRAPVGQGSALSSGFFYSSGSPGAPDGASNSPSLEVLLPLLWPLYRCRLLRRCWIYPLLLLLVSITLKFSHLPERPLLPPLLICMPHLQPGMGHPISLLLHHLLLLWVGPLNYKYRSGYARGYMSLSKLFLQLNRGPPLIPSLIPVIVLTLSFCPLTNGLMLSSSIWPLLLGTSLRRQWRFFNMLILFVTWPKDPWAHYGHIMIVSSDQASSRPPPTLGFGSSATIFPAVFTLCCMAAS